MAIYDFGLSSAEFGRMTPGMFAALLERRAFRFRYDNYIAGVVAAMVWNASPGRGKDSPVASAYDFVPRPAADAERDEIKRNISALFATVQIRTPEQAEKLRQRALAGLKAQGYADAEEIFDEVFAAWAAKRAETKGAAVN